MSSPVPPHLSVFYIRRWQVFDIWIIWFLISLKWLFLISFFIFLMFFFISLSFPSLNIIILSCIWRVCGFDNYFCKSCIIFDIYVFDKLYKFIFFPHWVSLKPVVWTIRTRLAIKASFSPPTISCPPKSGPSPSPPHRSHPHRGGHWSHPPLNRVTFLGHLRPRTMTILTTYPDLNSPPPNIFSIHSPITPKPGPKEVQSKPGHLNRNDFYWSFCLPKYPPCYLLMISPYHYKKKPWNMYISLYL